eukprot:5294613-Pyramimonas_sp.AAC.1
MASAHGTAAHPCTRHVDHVLASEKTPKGKRASGLLADAVFPGSARMIVLAQGVAARLILDSVATLA